VAVEEAPGFEGAAGWSAQRAGFWSVSKSQSVTTSAWPFGWETIASGTPAANWPCRKRWDLPDEVGWKFPISGDFQEMAGANFLAAVSWPNRWYQSRKRENHCRQLQRGCIRMLWRVGGEFGNAISVGSSTCVRSKFSRWRGRPPTAHNERDGSSHKAMTSS